MKTVTINGREFVLKFGFKAQFLYESATGKTYEGKTAADYAMLLFSALTAYNPDFSLELDDEFFDMIDENPTLLEEFDKVVAQWAEDRERKVAEAKKK